MRRVTRSDPDLRHLKRRETDRRDPLEDARVVTDGGTHEDDVRTDGGTVRRETPQTAATEHPEGYL
jgi:hypothetical protein